MIMFDEKNIGKNIKRFREEKGLTQQQVSTASGIQNTAISSYENSKKTPGLISLISLSKAMDVSLDELVFGTAAEKIINSSKDDSETVVRCIYELWKRGMITPPDAVEQMLFNHDIKPGSALLGVWHFNHPFAVDRLLDQLNDHKDNSETYSQPEKHIEQILESAIFDINKNSK